MTTGYEAITYRHIEIVAAQSRKQTRALERIAEALETLTTAVLAMSPAEAETVAEDLSIGERLAAMVQSVAAGRPCDHIGCSETANRVVGTSNGAMAGGIHACCGDHARCRTASDG